MSQTAVGIEQPGKDIQAILFGSRLVDKRDMLVARQFKLMQGFFEGVVFSLAAVRDKMHCAFLSIFFPARMHTDEKGIPINLRNDFRVGV